MNVQHIGNKLPVSNIVLDCFHGLDIGVLGCSVGSITFMIEEVIVEFTITQALASAERVPFFTFGFMIMSSMREILFFAVDDVVTAFSYQS